ncbi:hypothetical protein Tco_0962896 [Tanacetum coccineum]
MTILSEKIIEKERNRLEVKRPFEVRKEVYEKRGTRCKDICEYDDCKDDPLIYKEILGIGLGVGKMSALSSRGERGNSRGKRLAISMVVEAWLSEKEEV